MERTAFYRFGLPSAVQENADSNCVGVLDLDGNVVAPFVYDHVEALTDSYYLAVLAGKTSRWCCMTTISVQQMLWSGIAAHGKNHC